MCICIHMFFFQFICTKFLFGFVVFPPQLFCACTCFLIAAGMSQTMMMEGPLLHNSKIGLKSLLE